MPPSSLRRAPRVLPLALLAALAACDLPSSAPIFQQSWTVPGDSVTVPVTQILPAGVAFNGTATAFLVSVADPADFSTTLGTLCGQPACQSGAAVSAPVPAFTSSGAALSRTVAFPATVASGTVVSGSLSLAVQNTLGFDPLRPNGATAPYGTLTVTITNGASSTTTTFTGASQTMANNFTSFLSVPIPAGSYTGSFAVSASFDVPAGGTANLAAGNAISISPSVVDLTVSQVSVVVVNEAISTAPSAYDLEDIDFADRVEGGSIILDVSNPFTATATLNVVLSAPAQAGQPLVSISKAIVIPATPTSTTTVTLSKAELQSLVGKTGVNMTVSGTANGTGAGNTATVTPTSRIVMRSNIQVVVNVGG